ncbi:ANTAR domain-containing protein [Pseudothauera nasutitermitis]|uniref:ANTAR domain-containing protein n=1 Tax=Pseudothauera nasutitermitis TaxID=2565930 RepID=A0A4V3WB40_9RHOO|nr:nitrate regulatory protein [Pseudothauera nasutitermitis]THF61802.1 ANTAR domain-containing protein [Pseudothauera nasutitermitis]
MNSATGFLLAAKRCEIHALEQLALTAGLVGGIGRLVHGLQKERGASNIYLASGGTRFAAQRERIIAESAADEAEVRARFARLDTDAGHLAGGARLFSRIAWVLHGLDALAGLRAGIAARTLEAARATEAFSELIGGLLAVVFEAADTASDPAVTRALVALFNFMQGKELAGQERATGAAAFGAGCAEADLQQRLLHLIEAQERCFQVFEGFAERAELLLWRAAQGHAAVAELERLRRVLCTAPAGGMVDANLSDAWFDCCTRRLDEMRGIEDALAVGLQQLCERKIAEAQADLRDHALRVDALRGAPAPLAVFFERAAEADGAAGVLAADGLGPQLGRSVLDMLQAQARRLQSMSDELNAVRGALNERKLIERAKGLLMARRGMTEDQAYKLLRQTAMNQNRRLVEVAEATLALADFLPAGH